MKSIIAEQIEEIKEEFCTIYCKYTSMDIPEGKDEDWLLNDADSPCNDCPLNRL